tara:strand:+ start:1365 stop:1625 length:261 start_codon:yes stop_codon:yes gene_type:complete
MSKKMTPVSLLIEAMQEELESSPKEVWPGLEYAIAMAKRLLPEEKKIMCKFANDWADAREETDKMYNDIPGFEGTLDALDDLTDFS